MEKQDFLQKYNLTESQFLGKEEIKGSLNLRSLTSIPDGFNPTVGGSLDLENLTSIPDGFNPTVGGFLDLRSLTSIPDGFNPTVGGSLNLENLTSIPDGFNPTEYQNKNILFFEWVNVGGKFISCDGRFSEVISQKGKVWKLKDVNKDGEYFLVTDGKGKYAHGDTIKSAKEDLIYKISNRDKSAYKGIDLDKKMSFGGCIEMYRVITGSCSEGVKNFVQSSGIEKKSYTVREVIKKTKNQYGSELFAEFFKA
mgnify:CR=1 FL=1